MKIGLIDVDSKIPNLALMKLSAFYKQKGYDVELFQPIFKFKYDYIFASKIFDFSKNKYIPKRTIKGGSGYYLNVELDNEIEHIYPDYSLYNCNYAMGYLTRGCINKCPFCIVWKKEGILHKHSKLQEFRKDQKKIMLLDNSLTDYKHAMVELIQIRDLGLKLNLTQGFNIRTISPKIAKILSEIKLWKDKFWYIAWDNIHDEKKIFNGIKILNQAGIKNWKLMCYVLVGFNSSIKQDLYRINKLEKIGVDPFVMAYSKNAYTRALSKWCNRKPIFKTNPDFYEYIKSKKNYDEINLILYKDILRETE